jgi:hypothetical protein
MPPFAQGGRTHEELAPIGVGGRGGGDGLSAQVRAAHHHIDADILYIILIQPLLPTRKGQICLSSSSNVGATALISVHQMPLNWHNAVSSKLRQGL